MDMIENWHHNVNTFVFNALQTNFLTGFRKFLLCSFWRIRGYMQKLFLAVTTEFSLASVGCCFGSRDWINLRPLFWSLLFSVLNMWMCLSKGLIIFIKKIWTRLKCFVGLLNSLKSTSHPIEYWKPHDLAKHANIIYLFYF